MEAAGQFFAAAHTLATHTGSLSERLADAYADHLLQVTSNDLPAELQASFRELESRLNGEDGEDDDDDDDPIAVAAGNLNEADVHKLIDVILVLYGRLASARA